MTQKVVAKFAIEYVQVMDEKGKIDKKLMPKIKDSEIKDIYRMLVKIRTFDLKALKLQRQGRLGTYAPTWGQEASQVGTVWPLKKTDWVFPTFRENGAVIARGWPMHQLLQYWNGDERGQLIKDNRTFPIAIPVGTQAPHAVGAAWAAQIQKKKDVALVYMGDGGTSKGDVYEAMNMAGVFKLPVIFVCQNNGFAISVSRNNQTAAETLAQKAIGVGIYGVQVDGNDVLAVLKVTNEAVDRARKGKGPTFIECITYRMGDHTTSDDARRYRSEKEVKAWEKKDPILRLQLYMAGKKIWNKKEEGKLLEAVNKEVEAAVAKMEALDKPNPEDMFKYTFKEMPPILAEQMAEMKQMLELHEEPKEK